MKFFAVIVLSVCQLLHVCTTQSTATNVTGPNPSKIVESLLTTYDPVVSPNLITGHPIVVDVGLYVQEIFSISDSKMELMITLFIHRKWFDPRLNYTSLSTQDNIVLASAFVASLWVPDIYFKNERSASFHNISRSNEAIVLSRDGSVFHSSRYTLRLRCKMNLRAFPLDKQVCKLEMESFSYDTSMLLLRWRDANPVELPYKLYLQSFNLINISVGLCNRDYISGSFACLQLSFLLQRNYAYHIITTYIPSTLVVAVSWVAFWISPESVPGRTGLGTTTVLTVVTQSFVGGLSLPKVPYIKAVDIWNATCMTFVFLALAEFAVVNLVLRKAARRQLIEQTRSWEVKKAMIVGRLAATAKLMDIAQLVGELKPGGVNALAQKIDTMSRFLFPSSYAVFVIGYWVYYLKIYTSDAATA